MPRVRSELGEGPISELPDRSGKERLGESKVGGASGLVMPQRLLGELVELSGLHVGLHLRIPGGGIEFGEPLPELGELAGGKLLDLLFDLLDLGHYNASAKQQV